jgi:hypothetical protein
MFPKRVGQLLLDGVVSPEAERYEIGLKNINYLDNVFATYFIYCDAVGKGTCPYSMGSPKKTYQRFRNSLIQLNPESAARNWKNTTDITDALVTLKLAILGISYILMQGFGQLTEGLLLLERSLQSQNLSAFTNALAPVAAATEAHTDYQVAVTASDIDNVLYNKSLEDLMPMIREQGKQSIFGDAWSRITLNKVGWPIKSDDVFEGNSCPLLSSFAHIGRSIWWSDSHSHLIRLEHL